MHIARGSSVLNAFLVLQILPQKPGVVEQDEFERENSIGFSMERIAKEIGGSSSGAYAIAEALALQQEKKPPARRRMPGQAAKAGTRKRRGPSEPVRSRSTSTQVGQS